MESKIGDVLKFARESKGYTLRKVETETGISNAYLSQLENGKITKPSLSVVLKLCSCYEITLSTVSGLVDSENNVWSKVNALISMLSKEDIEKLSLFAEFLIYQRKKL